jgi:hypothetical protein
VAAQRNPTRPDTSVCRSARKAAANPGTLSAEERLEVGPQLDKRTARQLHHDCGPADGRRGARVATAGSLSERCGKEVPERGV